MGENSGLCQAELTDIFRCKFQVLCLETDTFLKRDFGVSFFVTWQDGLLVSIVFWSLKRHWNKNYQYFQSFDRAPLSVVTTGIYGIIITFQLAKFVGVIQSTLETGATSGTVRAGPGGARKHSHAGLPPVWKRRSLICSFQLGANPLSRHFRGGSLPSFEGLAQETPPKHAHGYFSDRGPTLVSAKRGDWTLLKQGLVRHIRTAPANQRSSLHFVFGFSRCIASLEGKLLLSVIDIHITEVERVLY